MSVSSATKVHAKGCREGRGEGGMGAAQSCLVFFPRMWVKGAVAKSSWRVGSPFKKQAQQYWRQLDITKLYAALTQETVCQRLSLLGMLGESQVGHDCFERGVLKKASPQAFDFAATSSCLQLLGQVEHISTGVTSTHPAQE